MKTAAERLKEARKAAGHRFAARAADAVGIVISTYNAYENGQNDFIKVAPHLARRFNVSLEWLLTGRGEMRPSKAFPSIPIMGIVSAGSAIVALEDHVAASERPDIALPDPGALAGLLVDGTSMFPRFLAGEIVLYDPEARPPTSLLGRYVVAQTLDGRMLVKKLKPGKKPGRFCLLSHNAEEEEDVEILATYAVVGVLLHKATEGDRSHGQSRATAPAATAPANRSGRNRKAKRRSV